MLRTGDAYFVPWADTYEWKDVKDKLMSKNADNLIRAYEIILMWKVKSNNLPAFIECTADILQVIVQEHVMTKETTSIFEDYDLRLSYSTALIRFLNHVHSIKGLKGDSLYASAKTNNIPDWVVTMRHDAAHGKNLPALKTLQIAAGICLNWLMENYWLNEEFYMSDMKSTTALGDEISVDKSNLQEIFKSVVKVMKMCYEAEEKSVRDVLELSDKEIECINNLIKLGEKNKYIQENCKSLNSLKKKVLLKNSKKPFEIKALRSVIESFAKVLLNATPHKNLFFEMFIQSSVISVNNEIKWSRMMRMIQWYDCLPALMKTLFKLAAEGNATASTLLSKLPLSVESLQRKWMIYKDLNKSNTSQVPQKKLWKMAEEMYKKQYPNIFCSFNYGRPPRITLGMLQDLLLNPSDYPTDIIFKYLQLISPPLSPSLLSIISRLIKTYCCLEPSNGSSDPSNDNYIHTLQDLDISSMLRNKGTESELRLSREDISSDGTWTKSTIGPEVWNKCPIGLLPDQAVVSCNIDKNVRWKPKVRNNKRDWTCLENYVAGEKRFRSDS